MCGRASPSSRPSIRSCGTSLSTGVCGCRLVRDTQLRSSRFSLCSERCAATPLAGESKYSAAASSRRFVYHSWFYPFAICTNAAARLSWAVYISPGQTLLKRHWVLLIAGAFHKPHSTDLKILPLPNPIRRPLRTGIELLRRAQWALLRLEHENSLAQCQCYIHAREAALRRPRSSTL